MENTKRKKIIELKQTKSGDELKSHSEKGKKLPDNQILKELTDEELMLECQKDNNTYGLLLRTCLRLEREEKEVDRKWFDLGVIPLMTGNGSFIIDGTERVLINQLYRSGGVSFNKTTGSATITPKYGSKVEIESSLGLPICSIRLMGINSTTKKYYSSMI